jgi:DNA-binding GntR family transcriptional regulator
MLSTINAYDKLRHAILSLERSPGEVLTERQLETYLETSRTTVRSALARLENEGLVSRDGRGYIVAPIDLREIQQACEFREVIEIAAAKVTIERAPDADLEALGHQLENTVLARQTAPDGLLALLDTNLETYMRDATDFHVSLARQSGNAFLVRALEDVLTRLARARWFEARTKPARDRANMEHKRILETIRSRDVGAAQREITAHLARSRDRLLSALLESSQLQIRGSTQSPSLKASRP